MVYCAAFDCNNDSRYTTGISYHCFPRDEPLWSQWLAKISQKSRLRSEHFAPDCLERDLKAEILGLKPRSTPKPGAIPTIFSHRRPSKRPRLSSEKCSVEKVRKEVAESWITVLQLGWVVAKLGLLQTIEAAHHLCMIDKKIERWMLFRGNNNLYLKGYHPNRFIEKYLIFAEKFFNSPLSKTISSYGILSSFNFFFWVIFVLCLSWKFLTRR